MFTSPHIHCHSVGADAEREAATAALTSFRLLVVYTWEVERFVAGKCEGDETIDAGQYATQERKRDFPHHDSSTTSRICHFISSRLYIWLTGDEMCVSCSVQELPK